MPTRFYLPHRNFPFPTLANVAPTSGAWIGTGHLQRVHLMLSVPSGATTLGWVGDYGPVTYNTGNQSLAAAGNVGLQHWVTTPLVGAQTIDGTVKAQSLVRESNAAADAMAQLVVRVFTPDLQTVRGTCYGGHTISPVSSEMNATTLTNRKFPHATLFPQTLTAVSASDGDVIVVSFGARKLETAATARTYDIVLATGSTDLPEDETTTTQTNAPWVEFSNTFTFADRPPARSSLSLMGIGVM